MQFLSLIGLVALLGLAWAMSYHRRRFPVRTVIWGLGLQFVFTLIILKEDRWSFFGMVVLAGLLVVYLMQQDQRRVLPGLPGVAAVFAGASAVGFAAGLVAPGALTLAGTQFYFVANQGDATATETLIVTTTTESGRDYVPAEMRKAQDEFSRENQ